MIKVGFRYVKVLDIWFKEWRLFGVVPVYSRPLTYVERTEYQLI